MKKIFKKIGYLFFIQLAYSLLLLIGLTSRKIFINYHIRDNFEKKKIPIIYSFWHNRLLYLAFLYRRRYVAVMVSQHQDGTYIADVMKKCRLVPIRGSSTRGGVRALLEIINYIKTSGYDIAFTPDGPRGPKYSLQEGVLLAGLKTGFPIVPICWNAKKKKILKSWDNFILPFPFNTFVIAYGEPVYIKNSAEIPEMKSRLEKEMMRIVDITDNYDYKKQGTGAGRKS